MTRRRQSQDRPCQLHEQAEGGRDCFGRSAKRPLTEREKPNSAPIRFSLRDGKELAMAGDGMSISTFDGLTGTPFAILDGHKAPVLALDYAAAGTLVSGSGRSDGQGLVALNPPLETGRSAGTEEKKPSR